MRCHLIIRKEQECFLKVSFNERSIKVSPYYSIFSTRSHQVDVCKSQVCCNSRRSKGEIKECTEDLCYLCNEIKQSLAGPDTIKYTRINSPNIVLERNSSRSGKHMSLAKPRVPSEV